MVTDLPETADESTMHPWPENDGVDSAPPPPDVRGGSGFADLLAAERTMLNRLSASSLPADVTRDVTTRLRAITDIVSEFQVPEWKRVDGWRPDLPGRGNALFPPYFIDDEQDGAVSGRVTFTRFFLGGNAAAHGGSQPLLFDDVLGRAMNTGLPGVARTTFLKVNYRRITPIDVELRFEVSRDRVEGRKRWGTGRLLSPSGELLSDAECLFLELLPGQP